MNKLAVLAMSLLLFFGAMLWYLANNTLNEFVSSQVILQGEYYTEQKVAIAQVAFNADTGSGTFANLSLSATNDVTDKIILINNVTVTLSSSNTASLLTEIDTVIIDELDLWLTDTNGSNIKAIITTITQQLIDIVPKKTPPKILPNGVIKKKREKVESRVKIANIVINKLTIHSASPEKLSSNHVISVENVSLAAIGGSKGLPANQLAAELLLQVFNHALSISSL